MNNCNAYKACHSPSYVKVGKSPKSSFVMLFISLFMTVLLGCHKSVNTKTFGLVINEDSSHFFKTRSAEEMNIATLNKFVDQYAGTRVTHLFLNPNAMRTSYRSKVWSNIWEDYNPEDPNVSGFRHQWIHNAWLLDQNGLDPYTVWIARCRNKKISPWISMRMNDIHHADDMNSPMHSKFWKEHCEYWRLPCSGSGIWTERALDYGIPEVREYNLSLIRELLERYDMDGLELDWMRFGFHFKPGHEEQGRKILIEFMHQVRKITQAWSIKRGHEIQVCVRVPAVPEYARGLGLDAVTWAKEDLVDMVVLTPFWTTADFDIPVEQWRELLGQATQKIVLAAGMELRIIGYPRQDPINNNIETMRGFTAAMLYRGANQIYLFNHMDSGTTIDNPDDYIKILHQAADINMVIDKPRRHIVTFHDTVPPGVARPLLLKKVVQEDHIPAQFRIYTGPQPTTGKTIIRVGLVDQQGVKDANFFARMNSAECQMLPDIPNPGSVCHSFRVIQFEVPLWAMQPGYNLAEIFLDKGPKQEIDWVEIYIAP